MDNSPGSIVYIENDREKDAAFSPEDHSVLDHINQKIAAGKDLDSILTFLFDNIQKIIPCDRLGIAFLEEQGRRMSIYRVLASYEPLYLADGYAADVRGSSLDHVFKSGTPRLINDLREYGRENPGSESTKLILKEGIRSSMTCPLRVEERPVGLLFLSSKKVSAYNEEDIRKHLFITERLSQAIEKAYIIEELKRTNSSYMEMLSFVTHELKSPLDSMITLGKTLTQGYYGDMDEKQGPIIKRIIDRAEGLSSMVLEYLNLSRFEGGREDQNRKKVNFINDVIEAALDIVLPQINDRGISITRDFPDEDVSVTCDPELIKIVMTNFISNAVKYGTDSGEVKISLRETGTAITVAVWNSGPGFPEDQKKNLFKKFSRIQTDELLKRKGTGIGLYTSWRIIQLHDGKITADSEEGSWAEFSFEIPK